MRIGARAPLAPALQKTVAETLVGLGRAADAADLLRHAISRDPQLELFLTLVDTVMPGPAYYQHLQWLHELVRPRTYLEIGVWHGQSLALAQPTTQVFGVDPEPKLDVTDLAANTRVYPVTSDKFFTDRPWIADSGPIRFDLAFIDGLHLFEQVLRDFINLERHCAPASVAIFHDTLPLVPIATERVASAMFWCGDVWKIVPCLERYRPDLRIVTIPTGPSGLSIVTGLDPDSDVLDVRFVEIVREMAALPYEVLEARLPGTIGAHRNSRDETARAAGVAL